MILEEDNYIKIQKNICEILPFIIKVFKYKWKILTNKNWEDGLTGDCFINSIYGKEIYESVKDIQKNMLKKGDTKQWDISILNIILKSKFFYDKEFQLETDKIVKIRNNISHKSKLMISDNEFKEYNCQINLYIKYIYKYLNEAIVKSDNFDINEKFDILNEAKKFKVLEKSNVEFCIYTNNLYPLLDYGNGLLDIGNNIDSISSLSHFCIFDVNKREYILNIHDIDNNNKYIIISINKKRCWTISENDDNVLITTSTYRLNINNSKCLWNIFHDGNSENIYFKNVYNNMFLCKDGFIGLFKNYQLFVNRKYANEWEQFKIIKINI